MEIIIIISIIIGIGLIIISYILTHNKGYPIKLGERRERKESQYECGIELMEETGGESRRKAEYIKYYIIGIIFLVFELETIILYPGIYNIIKERIGSGIGELEEIGIIEREKEYIKIIIIIGIILLGWIYEYIKKVI